jgi:hypothetical protein
LIWYFQICALVCPHRSAFSDPTRSFKGEQLKQLTKNSPRLWLSAPAGVVLLIFAAWQFYLFVTFKSLQGVIDLQGGRLHLWIAVVATVIASVTGFFVVSVLLRYDEKSELHIT